MKNSPLAKSERAGNAMLNALYSILNIEGFARFGGHDSGVDVDYPFKKVLEAIHQAEAAGFKSD